MAPQKKPTHWGWHWKVKNKHHQPRIACDWADAIDSFSMFNDYRQAE